MKAPLLIEIGTEEIPAGVAHNMAIELNIALHKLLNANGILLDPAYEGEGVTPRRLLFHAESCPVMQADREETVWGPPEKVAFDRGKPTRAAEGFAKKTGIPVDAFTLADKGDGKGLYMKGVRSVKGRKVADIIAEAMPGILRRLPSPKQMKWQDGKHRDDAFIRPIRWIVARLGDEVIPFSYAGVESGVMSRGHRVHGSSGEIDVNDPFGWLRKQCVIADWRERRKRIANDLTNAASDAGVALVEDEALLDEVTDLTEWPQVITGRYDEAYLRLPEEVVRIELKHHQRCFTSQATDGKLSNVFFAVANIASKAPQTVARGNERVVNARLADAAFYFERDPRESLEARVEKLSEIVFQEGLGMVGDQVRRLRGFVLDNAARLQVDSDVAQRTAYLCKSDLTTGLVGEFPELQGYMGGVYARLDGEPEAVATAIAEHYRPEGSDDALPKSAAACAIGIAERADKLLGYFLIGRIPSASTDPFGLRRAAIGLIRLLTNEGHPVQMPLSQVLKEAAKQWNQQRVTVTISAETEKRVLAFVTERLIGMAAHFDVSRPALEAALAAGVERPLLAHITVARLLTHFADSETGQAVAAANKRIANILKKAGETPGTVDASRFSEAAETALFASLEQAEAAFPDAPEAQLEVLAGLRQPVDHFFDEVMVMCEDEELRRNRLALLTRLRALFLRLADISRL